MKRIIIAALMLLSLNAGVQAQNVVREGKTFKQKATRSIGHKADTLLTAFTFEDTKGNKYPIIINKNSGSCYVMRTSKNGKIYKSYMKTEVSQQIAKELHIEYKPKNSK